MLVLMLAKLLTFTLSLLKLCVISSAHSHNPPPIEEVSSDLPWTKPANASVRSPLASLLNVFHMTLCVVPCAAAVQGHTQKKNHNRQLPSTVTLQQPGNKMTYTERTVSLHTSATCYGYVLVLELGQTHTCACMSAAALCNTSSHLTLHH